MATSELPAFDSGEASGRSFEEDQGRANEWASVPFEEVSNHLNAHLVEDLAYALVNLRDVADEHKRRAQAALSLEREVRRHLTRTAEVGLDRPSFEESQMMEAEKAASEATVTVERSRF